MSMPIVTKPSSTRTSTATTTFITTTVTRWVHLLGTPTPTAMNRSGTLIRTCPTSTTAMPTEASGREIHP